MSNPEEQSGQSSPEETDHSKPSTTRPPVPPRTSAGVGGEKPKFKVTRSPFAQRAENKMAQSGSTQPSPGITPPKVTPKPEQDAPAEPIVDKPVVGGKPANQSKAPFTEKAPVKSEKATDKPKSADKPKSVAPTPPKAQQEEQGKSSVLGLSVDVAIAVVAMIVAALIIINLVK